MRLSRLSAATLLGSCLLVACSPKVGDGSSPKRLYLGFSGEETAAQMTECTNVALTAYVEFTGDKGNTSNYNDRVTWESQNPSIVFVSDGISASPAGVVYPAGTLVALRPGAATISASYLDFHSSITVDVSELEDLHIDNALTDIGEELQQGFKLKAVLSEGQAEQDITGSGVWRFDPATAHAAVDAGTGVVDANSGTDGQFLRLVARLPECDREVSTRFRISPVTSTSIDYFERGDATALPFGFSEAFQVSAGFADPSAPRQNITTQTTLESIDDDYLSAVVGDDAWYVTALDRAGKGALRLKLGALDISLASKTWITQNTTLSALHLDAEELSIAYPSSGQLQVIGDFDNGLSMAITRHVSWTSSDSLLGSVASTRDQAGEVTIADTDGDFDVTASYTLDDEVLDDTIRIHAYAKSN